MRESDCSVNYASPRSRLQDQSPALVAQDRPSSPHSTGLFPTLIATIHIKVSGCSAGGRPDEETLLADIEVDVAADFVGNISTEVAAHYAVPYGFVFLLKGHLHVRGNQLSCVMSQLPTFSELEVSSAFVASLMAKSRISSSI